MFFEILGVSSLSFHQKPYPSQPRLPYHRPRLHSALPQPWKGVARLRMPSLSPQASSLPRPFLSTKKPQGSDLLLNINCQTSRVLIRLGPKHETLTSREPHTQRLQGISQAQLRRFKPRSKTTRKIESDIQPNRQNRLSGNKHHSPDVTVIQLLTLRRPKQVSLLFGCDFFYMSNYAFFEWKERQEKMYLRHRLKKRMKELRKVREARQKKEESLARARRRIQRSVERIIEGHSDTHRRKVKEKYHAKQTRRENKNGWRYDPPGEEHDFGNWTFGLPGPNGEREINPLDLLD